jgi:N-methylhydantoinase B
MRPGEAILWVNNGGGGYGDPTQRDPQRVARDVARGWLSVERAKDTYLGALERCEPGGEYAVDWDRTAAWRSARRIAV